MEANNEVKFNELIKLYTEGKLHPDAEAKLNAKWLVELFTEQLRLEDKYDKLLNDMPKYRVGILLPVFSNDGMKNISPEQLVDHVEIDGDVVIDAAELRNILVTNETNKALAISKGAELKAANTTIKQLNVTVGNLNERISGTLTARGSGGHLIYTVTGYDRSEPSLLNKKA